MSDPSDIDLDKPIAERPGDTKRRSGGPLLTVGAVAMLVLALVLALMYLRAPSRPPAPAAAAPAGPPETARGAEPGEQISLPPLDETDTLVRQLIERLSSHPTVAAWLATDGLILNFAVVTHGISKGQSPVQELRAIGPVPAFRARTSRGDLFIDPSSYRRYDRYAEALSALDSRGTARLYATLEPRILDAYRRLGQPTGDFDPVLERAIVELLRVPVVQGEVELVPSGIVYAFADPNLEGMSAAQKQLLRMGPQNVQGSRGSSARSPAILAFPPRGFLAPQFCLDNSSFSCLRGARQSCERALRNLSVRLEQS